MKGGDKMKYQIILHLDSENDKDRINFFEKHLKGEGDKHAAQRKIIDLAMKAENNK